MDDNIKTRNIQQTQYRVQQQYMLQQQQLQLQNNMLQQYKSQNQVQTQLKVNDYADTPPLSVKDWLLILLLQAIPCVNLVVLSVWAFGNGDVNRKRYCQASLIVLGIRIILSIVLISSLSFFLSGFVNWITERAIGAAFRELINWISSLM